MLAIELVRVLLGLGAYILGLIAIIGLFAKSSNIPTNTLLILATIALVIMFNI